MYQLDWFAHRKARARARAAPTSPVVWRLGYTSLLTDISSEMVNSLLPIYLVLHLHVGMLQYGAIDGIYNGVALASLSLVGGLIADRTRRPKEVAAFGYLVSTICKLLLLFGAAWSWIAAVIAVDRCGKGIRTAPRDAMISLATPNESLASAFALHRALDAGGALLGPVIAFVLLSLLPTAYNAAWLTSFVFGFLGLVVLWLFVKNPEQLAIASAKIFSWQTISGRGFWPIAVIGFLLSAMTMSDGFIYLLLQKRMDLKIGFFPLFYVITACVYMLLSVPLGRSADRFGRIYVLVLGNVVVGAIYFLLGATPLSGLSLGAICLLLLGIHYAATEGVLVAMASARLPVQHRSSALAVLATLVGLGKFASSILFGWIWQAQNASDALAFFGAGLTIAVVLALIWIREPSDESIAA